MPPSLLLRHILMAPEGDAGGGGGPPELVEVVLQGGIKVKLPKADADSYSAARAKDKIEREALATKAGTLEEERRAEAEKARIAIENAEALKLAKAGEIDKVRELVNREATAKVSKLAEKYRDRALESAIRGAKGLLQLDDKARQDTLVADVLAQVRGTSSYDLERDALVITGQDGRPAVDGQGQPMSADAHIAAWLEARPHFRAPAASDGSGGSGSGRRVDTGNARQVTRADLEAGRVDAAELSSGKAVFVE